MLAELPPYLLDQQERRPAHRLDCERAEQERHRAADQEANEDLGPLDAEAGLQQIRVRHE